MSLLEWVSGDLKMSSNALGESKGRVTPAPLTISRGLKTASNGKIMQDSCPGYRAAMDSCSLTASFLDDFDAEVLASSGPDIWTAVPSLQPNRQLLPTAWLSAVTLVTRQTAHCKDRGTNMCHFSAREHKL